MCVDRGWRQTVTDDDRVTAWAVATPEYILRCWIELSPPIRTPQIILAGLRAARHLQRRKSKRVEAGDNGWNIETGMNGIAGAGVIQGEFEQRRCRQAGAGAAEPDSCRGQMPQIAQ
jgi:hypothetical protein